MNIKERFVANKCCVIMPTYNNEGTLERMIKELLDYTDALIVIDDGCTDSSKEILARYAEKIILITQPTNFGKGRALRDGFQLALEMGFDYAISIDSDGQHFPSDLPGFLDEIETNPNTLAIGARNMNQENVPEKSSLGNKFSNFWFQLETGVKLTDTQSGYRLYPIRAMKSIRSYTHRFEYEVEVIVKASWRDILVKNIPIKIHYEAGDKRITHFRPFVDFTRIGLLNTYLVTLAVLYYIPRRVIRSLSRENIGKFIRENFFNEDEPIQRKVWSIGFGVFMGIFPVWGYQLIIGVAIAHIAKLNKALFVLAANISLPPMIPFIIYASYKLGSYLVEEPENDLLFSQGISIELISNNIKQYVLGAIALSFVAGVVAAGLTFIWLKRKSNIVR